MHWYNMQRPIGSFSGGQQTKVAFIKLLLSRPDIMLLDEPTNHMDMVGKEALEMMLKDFPGTVLFVSHDRYFIKQIATEILEFGQNTVKQYHCGYEDYLVEKGKLESVAKAGNTSNIKVASSNEPTLEDVFDKKTYYNPGKIKSRLLKQLEKYEKMLEESEAKAAELQMQLLDPVLATDYEKLMELQNQLDA